MLTLFKSLVLSRLDYGSQLWSPFKAKDIRLLESVQRAFTKHIQGMHTYSLDGRQCGNNLALCNFAVVMELPDSLWMNWKSEFGVIFLRCSPR